MKSRAITVDVELQNPNNLESIPEISEIRSWCEASIQKESADRLINNTLSVLIRIVNDKESADLNHKYRDKDGPTNVLSYPNDVPEFMLDIPELKEQSSHIGDLVICEPLVINEASDQNKSVMAHWAHLIVHGVLHLQGFDHIEDIEALKMESLEIKILEQLGFPNPYTHLS